MANEVLKRDENHVTVGAGVSPDSDFDISMLRTDPITNRLLINISDGSASSAIISSIASRDANHRPVCLAWDEANGVLQEILTDENGYLLCDVELI